jgi:hypothetical protein
VGRAGGAVLATATGQTRSTGTFGPLALGHPAQGPQYRCAASRKAPDRRSEALRIQTGCEGADCGKRPSVERGAARPGAIAVGGGAEAIGRPAYWDIWATLPPGFSTDAGASLRNAAATCNGEPLPQTCLPRTRLFTYPRPKVRYPPNRHRKAHLWWSRQQCQFRGS